jgi:hypothetical protein
MDYWVPGVQVSGMHEMVANALNLPGQGERTTNLRGDDLAELKAAAEEAEGQAHE